MMSEERLRMAAIRAGTALAEGLPEEHDHSFSSPFEKRMNRLIKRQKRGTHWGLKRAALFFLVICLAGGAWLTVDAQAREDLTGWFYARILAAYPQEETREVPSQPVTQELYDQYQAIVDEVNEQYDLDLVLRPIEEIGPYEMGHLESFRSDVNGLREILQDMQENPGGEWGTNLSAGEKLSRKLFGNPFLGIRLPEAGVGYKETPTTTTYYAGRYGLEWTLSPLIGVNCPVGPDPVYYIEDVSTMDMVPTSLPIGFSAVADGSAWYKLYEDRTHCAVFQRFILTKNLVSCAVTPWVVYHIDPTNGILDYGCDSNVGFYQVKPGRTGNGGSIWSEE